MPGSSLGGIADGLWGFVDNERRLSQDRENAAAQKEAALYSLLAEHGTEEFASMGLAGLAEMANPKRTAKGMRGFFGEMEKSQTLPRIRELMATPQVRQVETPGLPSRGIQQSTTMHAAPPGVQTGQPPPAPQGMPALISQGQLGSGAPPAPGDAFGEQRGTPEVGRVDQVSGPRQVLIRPEEQMGRNTVAREQAEVEGEVAGYVAAGMSRPEALELVKQSRMRRGLGVQGYQRVAVEDADGKQYAAVFSPQLGKYLDADTHEVLENVQPLTRTGSQQMGTLFEQAAKELGFKSGRDVPPGEATQRVNAKVEELTRGRAGAATTGRGEAAAKVPLSTAQRAVERGRLYDEWTKSSAALKTVQEQNASLKAGMEAARRGDLASGAEAVRVTFSKILDPNSVVMPGEFLRGNAALSLAQWVKGKMEQYKAGGIGVPLEELESYAQLAQEIEQAYAAFMEGERSRVETVAREGGIDPAGIFGSAQTPTMQQGKPALPTTTPSTGTATTPAPTAAPVAAPAAAPAKPTTMATVRAWAQQKGLSESAAIADIERRGFTITDKGQ